MVFHPIRGKSHADRLENFYQIQAADYDDFRKRLLKGREELWHALQPEKNAVWADMGGGTGSNLAFLEKNIHKLRKGYIVDLAGSLLNVANTRIAQNGWTNIETVKHDVITWQPPEKNLDVITFSYSLTMIPDWFAAIDHAYDLLKPGGKIAVVDFYLSRKFPNNNLIKHSLATRSFWPFWFQFNNVYPSADHVPYLTRKFETVQFFEGKGKVPYFPLFWWKMPYYIFIGQKPKNHHSA